MSSSVGSRLGRNSANNNKRNPTKRNDNLLPLLIIPGIMSSGLEVRKSAVHKRHVGERVWINPIALGFGKMQPGKTFTTSVVGGAKNKGLCQTQNGRMQRFKEYTDHESKAEKEKEELDCKSAWLQHMSLTSDMCTEREGNEIRPISGLDGVDFLVDIANINVGASYVFGPIIKLLKGIGYVKGLNLDACPYDWRIPPSVLEERDGYFTKTMERIERMYSENNGKPVVLLCHSMGGKTGHYLLNFVLETKGAAAGRDWIDRMVHTYMPLGAVHIGVPFIIGSAFSAGLNPILDQMLSLKERLVFSRSLGSGVWLMPKILPSIERNAPPAILCKREGKLTIEILATPENPLGDLRALVTNQYGSREVGIFQIKVSYGDKKTDDGRTKQRSGKARPVAAPKDSNDNPDAQYFELPCAKFVYPTPPSLNNNNSNNININSNINSNSNSNSNIRPSPLKPIRFTLCERGNFLSSELEPAGKIVEGIRFLSKGHQMARLWNMYAKKTRKYKISLGMSSPIDDIDVHELVQAGDKGLTINVPIVARVDMTLLGMEVKKNRRSIDMKVNIKWEPPPSNENDDLSNPIAMIPSRISLFAPIPDIRSTRVDDEKNDYVPLSGQAMLREEGLEDSLVALAREKYSPQLDRVGPRDRSSHERPPVKRIYAIYGINLDTAVSTICKRVPSYHEDETPEELLARPRFEVDSETCLGGDDIDQTSSGHKLEDGTLFEHSGTPQINLLTGERIHRSGDGSVPYYCLQQSQVWANELRTDPNAIKRGDKIRIEELEGAEHRAVLSDERFHALLVDYLKGRTSI
jgi:hypothetical protein